MRVPSATCRLQLHGGLGFAGARELLPYLHALGVSDLYLPPILAARPGSTHGYDVVDPTRLDPALGSDEELQALAGAAREWGLGMLLDIVPNHMAASELNPWWRDVLRWGRSSPWARAFDVTWSPPWPGAEGVLLLPILGDHYGHVLERGELGVGLADDGFVLTVYDRALPLDPTTCGAVLEGEGGALGRVGRTLGAADPQTAKGRQAAERAVRELLALREADPAVAAQLQRLLGALRTAPARLDALLGAQHYRLAIWRTGSREVNYRRFFDISDLAGVRCEDEHVREALHALVLRLCDEGIVTGLRVDHVDGLRDPRAYLTWLQERLGGGYVVVEKILSGDEELPADWPVAGTTGYDMMNLVSGLYVDAAGLDALGALYARVTGVREDFATIAHERQKAVMARLLRAEVVLATRALAEVARRLPLGRDVAVEQLEAALVGATASLPVYRTYIEARVGERDRALIGEALDDARARDPDVDPVAWDVLERALLLEVPEDQAPAARRFVSRWQQLTPPVIAKGVEDTSLYVYNRLISLNTVGGEPDRGLVSLAAFHDACARRQQRWPTALSASATHDSKRGEDVRARIHVLSELAPAWEEHLVRWMAANERHRREVAGTLVPDRNEELLIYQTLIGAWPLADPEIPALRDRLREYLRKAAREAKEHTSWRRPDEEHEAALLSFADAILYDAEFLRDFVPFERTIAFYGAVNGLSQTLVKIAAPGVPDLYQGTELWSLTLVDPDNRRPVDWETRRRALAGIVATPAEERAALVRDLLAAWPDGRIKLLVTWAALQHRRRSPSLYLQGAYVPVHADGAYRRHVCAFARHHADAWALCVTPRLIAGLVRPGEFPVGTAWGSASLTLPPGAPSVWRDVIAGGEVEAGERASGLPLRQVLGRAPVALLEPA